MNCESKTKKFALLIPDNLQLTEFVLFTECLEIANRLMDGSAFKYDTIWLNDYVSNCESEAQNLQDWSQSQDEQFDAIVIFGGNSALDKSSPQNLNWLRRQARHGAFVGSIANGIFTLARSGILEGKHVALPRYSAAVFQESFPEIEITDNIYLIDERLFTCCGGVATIDLAIRIVARFHGYEVADNIADGFVYDLGTRQAQRKDTSMERRLSQTSPPMYTAVKIMKENIETPLPIKMVAHKANISVRQLERKFSSLASTTPHQYYMGLRLSHARSLLLETNLSVTEISQASGFRSLTYFTKNYRCQFKKNPSDERSRDGIIEAAKNYGVVEYLVKSRSLLDERSIYPPSFLLSTDSDTNLQRFPPVL